VRLDASYTTPDQSHAMMEPHASIAAWKGDKLTVWTSNQMINWGKGDMAKLGIPKEKVRLVSPYIGGGFGGKLFLRAEACWRRWAPAAQPPGQGRAAAAADDEQHHAPPGHHPAHPHRRQP
jgi:CO/xanthine dehydrogenase Mo-binding subunit